MFASRSNSSPIFLVTIFAVVVQLAVMLTKANTLTDAPAQVRIVDGRIWLGERRLSRSSKLWSPKTRKAVYQHVTTLPNDQAAQRLIDHARDRRFAPQAPGKLGCWVGVCGESDLEIDLVDAPHIAIIGPTGSGKSQLLRLMLTSLASVNDERSLRLAIVDFKGSAMSLGLDLRNLVERQIDDLNQQCHLEFWTWLELELTEREHFLQVNRVGDWSQLPEASARLVVVIDEAGAAARSSMQAHAALVAMAARGRSLGVHLVVTNQGTAGLPRELMLNLRTRIALEAIDQVELVQLGGSAKKITGASQGWIAARLISQSKDDLDFSFPVGVS